MWICERGAHAPMPLLADGPQLLHDAQVDPEDIPAFVGAAVVEKVLPIRRDERAVLRLFRIYLAPEVDCFGPTAVWRLERHVEIVASETRRFCRAEDEEGSIRSDAGIPLVPLRVDFFSHSYRC